MGISIRAYSRHRGVSDTAVHKAIQSGRITTEPDGTIDMTKADAQWEANTNKAQQRSTQKAVPTAALETVDDTLRESGMGTGGSTTYVQARTANEVIKAQTSKLKYQQLKGELVDRAQALAHVFKLARAERDAWGGWPSRVSAQMAAELDVDAHTMYVTLEQYVRQHLSELADIKPKVD
jgi:hypothetical protein